MENLPAAKYKDTHIYMVNWFSAKVHRKKKIRNEMYLELTSIADIILKYFQINYTL